MTIVVVSLDHDGSIHNERCVDSSIESLIAANINLSNYIKAITKHPIVLNGSNRQSFDIELANRFSTGSACFENIEKFVEALGGTFDPFLLEDLFNDKEPGFSYQRACDLFKLAKSADKHDILCKAETLTPCPSDRHKKLLVFAQIQKIANQLQCESPGESIDFHFVDDRKDILGALHHFFNTYPFMIPKNVTLNLVHYQHGETPVPYKDKLQGTGMIHSNYKEITKQMSNDFFNINQDEKGMIQITAQEREEVRATSVPLAATFFTAPLQRVKKQCPPPEEDSGAQLTT